MGQFHDRRGELTRARGRLAESNRAKPPPSPSTPPPPSDKPKLHITHALHTLYARAGHGRAHGRN